ncbi:DUF2076 domain-containing protein [Noviherbaspirillum pedocola]|uniref:DUF2076 family protein n=1 Tax=Noviherbaspirillum pedocola TaxID=2801341 RepID=A0A934W5P7_9BURK|nr:DUF2076 domain-containing protein [Noviherbaspirillum pedocola]MBK4735207.1 DUF2076 family protein [Noviherbaspirillum pedocola]
MSPQEAQMLQTFLNQLVQATNVQKDPEANAMISNAISRQPDAAYLLVQRAMLMEQALDAAKAQISTLQNQLQSSQPPNRGFLDSANSWGNHPAPSTSRPSSVPAPAYPTAGQYQAPGAYPPPQQYTQPAPPASQGFFGGRAGSFLGSAAATAAGVAGGAFLFQGIENMLGHHGGSGFMNPAGAGSFNEPIENTTVNNYYLDDNSMANSRDDRDSYSSDQNNVVSDGSSDFSSDPGSDDDSFI